MLLFELRNILSLLKVQILEMKPEQEYTKALSVQRQQWCSDRVNSTEFLFVITVEFYENTAFH